MTRSWPSPRRIRNTTPCSAWTSCPTIESRCCGVFFKTTRSLEQKAVEVDEFQAAATALPIIEAACTIQFAAPPRLPGSQLSSLIFSDPATACPPIGDSDPYDEVPFPAHAVHRAIPIGWPHRPAIRHATAADRPLSRAGAGLCYRRQFDPDGRAASRKHVRGHRLFAARRLPPAATPSLRWA